MYASCYFCKDCIFLDKTKREESNSGCYRYGCKSNTDSFIIGWIRNDRELKYMGCSYGRKIILKPGDRFFVKSRTVNVVEPYLYCGKIGNNYLIIKTKTKPYVFSLVNKNYLRGQTGMIDSTFELIKQTKEQMEESKKLAKELKERALIKTCRKS